MRAFWQAVEAGLHTVRLCNLADGMDPEGLAALHAAGVLRATHNFDLEELSWGAHQSSARLNPVVRPVSS